MPASFPLLAAVLIAIAPADVPVAAQSAAGAQNQDTLTVTGRKKKDPMRRICKTSASTGSIMQRSTCRTVADWEIITERSAVALDKAQQAQEADRLVRELRAKP